MRNWFRPQTPEGGARKKLLVHVGANKTGSTAIQRFLHANAQKLNSEGIIVPGNDLQVKCQVHGAQTMIFQELLEDVENGKDRFQYLLENLDRANFNAHSMVLSAENLTNMVPAPEAPRLFADLSERYDVEVIMYVRRQDDFILSSWQQWYSKVSTDFWAWTTSVVGEIGNWQTHLQNWERVVPRDSIIVRVYERPKLKDGDAIADFHALLGAKRAFGDFDYPKRTANPSYSNAIVDLVKGNDAIFDNAHDNEFYKFVAKMTGDRYVKSSRESAITFAQRQAINTRYAASNEWVRNNYFPDSEGSLFTPPKESDYDHVPQEELDREKLEFLATLVYQTYKGMNEKQGNGRNLSAQ